jgi:hypothetical protein
MNYNEGGRIKQILGQNLGLLFLRGGYYISGVYILENTTPPRGGGEISTDVIWGKKYEKAKRKRGKNFKKEEKREKNKEERGKKMGKWEVKG